MYVPLRVHGHHSMLTGVDAPRALLERASVLGHPGHALTDVDSLGGAVDFTRSSPKVPNVHAIVGAEISDAGGLPGRVVALATNAQGWRHLCRIISARHLGGDPGEPGAKLDGADAFQLVDAIVRWQAGLVLLADHPRLLMELAGRVDERSLFAAISPASLAIRASAAQRGPRNAAHAPHRSAGIDAFDLKKRNSEEQLETPKVPAPEPPVPAQDLVEAARACGVATLAVPDVYAATAAGFVDHRARVAIKHNALLHDLPDAWLAARPMHLLAPAEMRALYADLPEVCGPFERRHLGALERTLEVAERCKFLPELDGILFPTIALEPSETPFSRLAGFAFAGASERFRPLRPEVVRRLEYELATIERLGFSSYFLLVKQIADFAKGRGIPCVGRGSAADSMVAYCLRLTDADPLRYRLTFERFLNPARKDRPDIDLDFCWRRRDEVLDHVYGLFGAERTAMICTIATCGGRAAFRESALVEGVPPAEVNRWSRGIPMYGISNNEKAFDLGLQRAPLSDEELARDRRRAAQAGALPAALSGNLIAQTLARTPEARGFPFDDPRLQRALNAAARLAGAPRHYGLHPGGVVVSPGPITDFVPCQRAAKGCIVTQFDKDAVEAIGLVKMDLLGNRALTTLDDCVRALAQRGVDVDLEKIPEDDPATEKTLREGRTVGCFQVESPGMRNLLCQIGARTMDDVIQAVALIRPGPASSGMKDAYVRRYRGLEARHAPHARLTELLWDTYGVMLYQEDVMHVASRLTGMDLAEADLLRRALRKRGGSEIEALCARFVAGAAEQGVERGDALKVWDLIANFASFAFCKAHSVTYGRISYRAVWLKTHHPAEYLAAFLASETGYYDPRVYVEEARRMGVAILGPCVNRAQLDSTAVPQRGGPAIRIGLRHVKGMSQKTLEAIVAARSGGGPFTSLPDFLERTGAQGDEAEALIRCGAFDGMDRTIPELLWRLHMLRAPSRRVPPGAGLDAREMAALRATPSSREALKAARAKTAGWSGAGIGAANVELQPGESALLFAAPETGAAALPRMQDYDALTRGRLEHEGLGLTIVAHPTTLFPCPADARIAARELAGAARPHLPNPTAAREVPHRAGARITLRGWPAATRHVRTADGRTMRFLTLEDETALAEVVIFPDVYERDGAHLAEFGVLCVTGTVEDQMGACSLHAEVIW